MVMAVVTSLVALSSSSACSRMASILLLFQSIEFLGSYASCSSFLNCIQSFLTQQSSFRCLFFQVRNNFLRCLGEKASFVSWRSALIKHFFILFQLLVQALPLRGDVDLLFIRQSGGEVCRGSGVSGV